MRLDINIYDIRIQVLDDWRRGMNKAELGIVGRKICTSIRGTRVEMAN